MGKKCNAANDPTPTSIRIIMLHTERERKIENGPKEYSEWNVNDGN